MKNHVAIPLTDWEHLKRVIADYRDVVDSYPEVITSRKEDQLLIAEEIVNEDIDS